MNVYTMGLLANLGINIMCALSVYIIIRSGQISIGNAGFMAVGAYCAAILSSRGLPIPLGIVLGGCLAGVVGALVGFPALRLKGTYLVIGTIGFTSMVRSLAQIMDITGGAAGFRGIKHISVPHIFVYTVLIILALAAFERTRLGISLRAVAAEEQAAGAVGINVTAVKVLSFAAGAFMAGIAGGCYAHWTQYIEPNDFSTMLSTMMVLPVILGGPNRILGAVVGAGIFTFLPELLRFANTWRYVAYGAIVIFIVIIRPQGLIPARRGKKGR